MKAGVRFTSELANLVVCTAIGQAGGIGWPEAVARLTKERSNAEVCVASLKGRGNSEQVSRGRLMYGAAKADLDAVIAGLMTALAEGGNPESLPSSPRADGRPSMHETVLQSFGVVGIEVGLLLGARKPVS